MRKTKDTSNRKVSKASPKITKMTVRIPTEITDAITQIAEMTDRSVNGMVVNSLRKTVCEFMPDFKSQEAM